MLKTTKKMIYLPACPTLYVGAGGGGGGGGSPVFLYQASPALNADDANPGFSFRVVVPVAINGLSQARVTIRPGSVNALTINNASIGKRDPAESILPNTTAMPIELLFGGVSGFIGATTPITSDWADISSLGLVAGDKLVCIYDIAAGGASTASQRLNNASTGVETWFQSSASYHVANVQSLGFSDIANTNYAIDSVETQ